MFSTWALAPVAVRTTTAHANGYVTDFMGGPPGRHYTALAGSGVISNGLMRITRCEDGRG